MGSTTSTDYSHSRAGVNLGILRSEFVKIKANSAEQEYRNNYFKEHGYLAEKFFNVSPCNFLANLSALYANSNTKKKPLNKYVLINSARTEEQ